MLWYLYIYLIIQILHILSQPYKEQRMGIIISHSTFSKSSYITLSLTVDFYQIRTVFPIVSCRFPLGCPANISNRSFKQYFNSPFLPPSCSTKCTCLPVSTSQVEHGIASSQKSGLEISETPESAHCLSSQPRPSPRS